MTPLPNRKRFLVTTAELDRPRYARSSPTRCSLHRSELLNENIVPIVVKVAGCLTCSRYFLLVPTSVMVVGGIQGLVEIANEVQQELQSDDLLFRIGIWVR